MALFDRHNAAPDRYEDDELVRSSDAATRALSVTAVENDFVEGVYDKLAKVYDLIFGPTLHPGRLQAIKRMDIQPGERVLEVGVGTGINLSLYPSDCHVTGIDFSSSMLEKARERAARKELPVRLLQMDAADLRFADDAFDIVYAPYLISVVPDPVRVAREMRRVCRPGGRIIFLNHFLSPNPILSRLERAISPLTIHIGFKSDLDLPAFLAQAELEPISIEKVNVPKIWSLVTSVK
ncbi:MAG TPA: methyltransferase domain-containing protein [Vicinamibacterales bacterium]|jgi:phosphatidylethanolamine/phosphatidyl-N-methylethanolamine N-methyltransferase|nr:methyltransferase domain-containing protein [Vicinamibacterales bacterium]